MKRPSMSRMAGPKATSKPPEKPESSPRHFTESEIDILCTNCMKYIPSSMIAEHSDKCQHVNSEVKLMEMSPQIQQVTYKISRLKEVLIRLSNDSALLAHKPANACNIKMLISYADDLISITDYTQTDIARFDNVIKNLSVISKGFTGSPCIKVYIERLYVLAMEKHVQLVNYYKEMTIINPSYTTNITKTTEELLNEKQQKMEQLRKSKDSVKDLARVSIDSKNSLRMRPSYIQRQNPVNDDVRSTLGLNDSRISRESKLSVTSNATITSEKLQQVDQVIAEEEHKRSANDQLKRDFYTLVDNNKKLLGKRHPGYYVNTAIMLTFVIQNSIPKGDWPKFVEEEMSKNPEKWRGGAQIKKANEILRRRNAIKETYVWVFKIIIGI